MAYAWYMYGHHLLELHLEGPANVRAAGCNAAGRMRTCAEVRAQRQGRVRSGGWAARRWRGAALEGGGGAPCRAVAGALRHVGDGREGGRQAGRGGERALARLLVLRLLRLQPADVHLVLVVGSALRPSRGAGGGAGPREPWRAGRGGLRSFVPARGGNARGNVRGNAGGNAGAGCRAHGMVAPARWVRRGAAATPGGRSAGGRRAPATRRWRRARSSARPRRQAKRRRRRCRRPRAVGRSRAVTTAEGRASGAVRPPWSAASAARRRPRRRRWGCPARLRPHALCQRLRAYATRVRGVLLLPRQAW